MDPKARLGAIRPRRVGGDETSGTGVDEFPADEAAARRAPVIAASVAVILVLAAANVAIHRVRNGDLWLGPAGALALLVCARLRAISWQQLGLGRDRLRSGVAWGLTAIAAVSVIFLVGVLLPETRPAFRDARYHLDVPAALLSAFVVIPVGTVLFEEVAFRSVLWAVLTRHESTKRVLLITSGLFGLWHVLAALHLASTNQGVHAGLAWTGRWVTVIAVLATVALTAAGGLVFGELRRRSGSLLASVCAHWATNALGVLYAVLAWKLVK